MASDLRPDDAERVGGADIAQPDQLKRLKNIGILAHVDAGKTSITERILMLAGITKSAGSVDEGTTVTDYLSVERHHGITVKSAAVRFRWGDCSVHLIDTPGHVDFGMEVDRVIRIMDGAVIALCAVSGVQARTEIIAKACQNRSIARLYFINKMDRAGADFAGVVESLAAQLEPNAMAVQFPLYEANKWVGIVDLITMTVHREGGVEGGLESGGDLSEWPEPQRRQAAQARSALLLRLAENDEVMFELFASDKEPSEEMLRRSLAACVRKGLVVPVLCGSAFVDYSVGLLLDAVVLCLPSYREAPTPEGVDPKTGRPLSFAPSPQSPFSAFVFKTTVSATGDRYAWARVWSGRIDAGKKIYEARSGKDFFIKKIYAIQADSLEPADSAAAGDIVAIAANALEPGASLCERSHPIVYEKLVIPAPVVSLVVEPSAASDISPLRDALAALATEDSSLIVKEERETGRFEISGQGELHLDIVIERLRREYGLKVRAGQPQVNCKERLRRPVRVTEAFDHDFGGERLRVTVELEAAPGGPEANAVQFADGLKPTPRFADALRRGVESALSVGPLAGWPLQEVATRIVSFVPPAQGRNSDVAVEAAAAQAFRRAAREAGSVLLEPVMQVDIECPEEYFGKVLGAINARGGQIESVEDGPWGKNISAAAPMRQLFGFAGELRSLSRGRVQFQARFKGNSVVLPAQTSTAPFSH